MKQYKTIITKDYVPDWSVANGIREWVTNALDSPAKFQYILQDDYIELRSVGITLPAKCLALGVSSHRGDPNAVGQHGEDSLVLEIPSVVTEDNNETTIQQALLDYDVAQHIHNHNQVREGIVNESILERTGQEVKLRPIQLKNLRIVVIG